jgi:hypothetical protein
VAIILSFVNAVFVVWGVHRLASDASPSDGLCSVTLARSWLAVGVICAASNIALVCWFVWQLQRRVLAGHVDEEHTIVRFVIGSPKPVAPCFAAAFVFQVIWIGLAMDVYHSASRYGASNNDGGCTDILNMFPVGTSLLCAHWGLLALLVPLTIMTECAKMPRWRVRAIVRAIRRREMQALRGQPRTLNGAEYDELENDPADGGSDEGAVEMADVPFSGNLNKSLEVARKEFVSSRLHQRRPSPADGKTSSHHAVDARSPPPSLQEPQQQQPAGGPTKGAAASRLPTAVSAQRLRDQQQCQQRSAAAAWSEGSSVRGDIARGTSGGPPVKAVFAGGVPGRGRGNQSNLPAAGAASKYAVSAAVTVSNDDDVELPDFDE